MLFKLELFTEHFISDHKHMATYNILAGERHNRSSSLTDALMLTWALIIHNCLTENQNEDMIYNIKVFNFRGININHRKPSSIPSNNIFSQSL